jgi:orotate phosphoribosyltransferase
MPNDAAQPTYQFAEETLRILREAHAILENDHFVYVSGDHGSGWIDKDAIYPHTERIERLGRDMAKVVRGWKSRWCAGRRRAA